jgi:hypothetical protein
MNDWRKLREDAGFSMRDLMVSYGGFLGVRRTFLSRIEAGDQPCPIDLAMTLGKIYESQVVLFEWEWKEVPYRLVQTQSCGLRAEFLLNAEWVSASRPVELCIGILRALGEDQR